ncbi:sugar transferase [Bacteroidales bacterium OttesenSCG-928-I21]|nr:sugar transferase [Bacteroidales bacterium OttesenSCG-928-I21]
MLVNFLLLILTFYIVVSWFPFVTADPKNKYLEPYLIFIPISFFCGISFKKYHSYLFRSLRSVLKSILKADLLALVLASIIISFFPSYNLSIYALLTFVAVLFLLELLSAFIYYSFKYAANIEKYEFRQEVKNRDKPLKNNYLLNENTIIRIERAVSEKSGEIALLKLKEKTELHYANTLVVDTTGIFNIHNLAENRFSTIINLARTNEIRGINDFFVSVHDKLPYEGIYVGCFLPKSQYKKKFLSKYPFGINHVFYTFDYIFKRIFPKWGFTREIYFWATNGRNRILTKSEVFGRLYAAGFEIEDEFKAKGLTYFKAIKKKEPIRHEIFNHGPIVKLNRVGKNGREFKVYKFRTMHSYSEFLQSYIYEKNSLREGGKFNHDIRITTLGACMRKYWLDELPMLLNLLKGDMKLVGIRPLSKHYFSLYSEELQEKRTKVKPGLLPPFYADMPKTLDEIQASELKYLNECEKNGTFSTDIKYLWHIFVNIVFRKARSK